MKSAYIYVRVSSTGQADHGESLETQEAVCRAYAEHNGYRVDDVFSEPYTGRKNDRPILDQLFAHLESREEKVDAVIIRYIDRFTRGGAVLYRELKDRLRAHGIALLDTAGTIQPSRNALEHLGFEYDWSVASPSRASEVIAAENANEEVRKILIRTVEEQIQLVQQGYRTRPAPLGFRNARIEDQRGKKKTILEPDPDEAPWLQFAFRLRAEGLHSDPEICRQVNAIGFRTRLRKKRHAITREIIGTTGGEQLTPRMLQKLIRRPHYCGIICEKWTHRRPLRAPYPGLVSIDQFNRANRGKIAIVENRDGTVEIKRGSEILRRQKNNPTYPFRFVVRCPHCGKPFKGSAARGKLGKRYPGYHCSRNHPYFRVPQPTFHKTVEQFAQELRFRREFLSLFEAVARDVWRIKEGETEQIAEQALATEQELQCQQQHLVSQFTQTESPVVKKLLEKQIEELEEKIATSSSAPKKPGLEERNLKEYLTRARQLVEHPAEVLLDSTNQQSLQQTWGLLFEELPTYEDLVGGTPEMAVVFELCRNSSLEKGQLVALLSARWNTFVKQVEAGCQIPLELLEISQQSAV